MKLFIIIAVSLWIIMGLLTGSASYRLICFLMNGDVTSEQDGVTKNLKDGLSAFDEAVFEFMVEHPIFTTISGIWQWPYCWYKFGMKPMAQLIYADLKLQFKRGH